MCWDYFHLSCLWRRWRRSSRTVRSVLEGFEEFIKILFGNLRQWDILGVILADVEAGNERDDFGKGTHIINMGRNM